MPIFGAFLGAMIAVWTLSFFHILWGVAIGFLLGAVYHFQLKIEKTEESLTSEIFQLRTRMRELELRMKAHVMQPPVAMEARAPEPVQQLKPVQQPEPVSPPEIVLPPVPAQQPEPVFRAQIAPNIDRKPSVYDSVVNYFSTGNTIAKVGVVLLFFGVSFLLKYVSDQGFFPIELRLLFTACGAVLLLSLGWKLRLQKGPFGLILQGAGIGVFYLTVFASFRLYDLIPAPLAFTLLLLAVVLSSCLAVLQDSRALAVFSMTGGFLAPVLASTGKGSHVMLFGYYAGLNLGILGMSWYRSWQELNRVGFAFTFVISGVWGYQYYRPEFFASTEPFLIFFFLLYFAVTLLFAQRRTGDALIVDSALLFGVPATAFMLQAGLVKGTTHGLAWSAVAFGAFYLGAARMVLRQWGSQFRLLVEAFFGLGVCFLTLAVPFAFDGRATAAVWALEGAAALWIGIRQNRLLVRCSGMALQVLAGIAFCVAESRPPESLPVLNAFYMGTFVLALSHLWVAFSLLRTDASLVRPWEKQLVPFFMVIGLLWWGGGGLIELSYSVPIWYRLTTAEQWTRGGETYSVLLFGFVLFFGFSSLLFSSLSTRLSWRALGSLRLGLMPLLTVVALFLLLTGTHPLANIGIIAWTAAFAIHYRSLHTSELRHGFGFSAVQHYVAFWLLVFLASWEVNWFASYFIESSSVWGLAALAVTPSLIGLYLVFSVSSSRAKYWPLGAHRDKYLGAGLLPLLVWAPLWMVFLNCTNSGDPRLLPYVPIVNPIDLSQLTVFLFLGYWYLQGKRTQLAFLPGIREFSAAIGTSAFVWLTAGLTRTLHHWAGEPWDFAALFGSLAVQAALSIFWSVIALALMILATRRNWRVLWIAGASLLAIVVVKLIGVDLSGRGTLERIVSFIGTGILLLVIGYLAPIPPDAEKAPTEAR
jgi:uncharacterized membrane protein